MLKGKNILLGVSGGIAAYKTASLTRLLIKKGAKVKVIMTSAAKEFITPLTLATLSKNPISVDFFNPENGEWNSHVDLGLWADAYLIAPATANSIGKMANGIADNLLITTYLSTKCPVFLAPTMDLDMYKHQANQKNIATLKTYGNHIIEAEEGELASGLVGKGRMAEPETICEYLSIFFSQKKNDFAKKNILVTAGATYEKIDPVRFIANHSSGKMGYAIAHELAKRGAKVTLISGPTDLTISHPHITKIDVTSAEEMYKQSLKVFKNSDAGIMTAAVADYTVKNIAKQKIKKLTDKLTLELEKTTDIAKELGKIKTEKQILVGFALETENEQENAQRKLKEKNFDFIVLNSMNEKGAGFKHNTNKISIFTSKNEIIHFELKSKTEVAEDIANELSKWIL